MARYASLLQMAIMLAILALGAWIASKLFSWNKGAADTARFLKEETILGLPSRGIDESISVLTGREETLGGWIAELMSPSTRAANAMLQSAPKINPYAVNPRDRS